MKEEFNTDMESLRKSDQSEILQIKSSINQIKNTVESYASRLEQVEDRISGHKNNIDIKEKTEFLDKRLKNCKKNAQELCNFIKRPNLQIMGIEEGKRCKSNVYVIYSTE
jgi:chromosome segregation ATPase